MAVPKFDERGNKNLLEKVIRKMKPMEYASIIPSLPKHFEILDPYRVMYPHLYESGFEYPNPSRDIYPCEATLTIGSLDPWEWAAQPYCENTEHLENKVHMTRFGRLCRSKSEALIFEIYMDLGIPFHYDETLTIGGKMISPDFNGVKIDGTRVFHEHLGMHNSEYRARYDWKSSLYAAADILPGVNLLYTYDNASGSINVKLVEAQTRDIYGL